MMKLVDQHNFMDVIDLSMDLKMKALERKCSQLFIKHNNLEVFESSKSDELQLGLSEEEGT